jgi:anti-sigma B factor antagonist
MENGDPRRDPPSTPAGALDIQIEAGGPEVRVVPVGNLDLATSPALEGALRKAAAAPDMRRVVVDLGEVTFFDVSALRVLSEAAEAARRGGFEFGVVRPRHHVRRLFVLTGLDHLLPLVDT